VIVWETIEPIAFGSRPFSKGKEPFCSGTTAFRRRLCPEKTSTKCSKKRIGSFELIGDSGINPPADNGVLASYKRGWNCGGIGRGDNHMLDSRQVLPEAVAATRVEFRKNIIEDYHRVTGD
jgi:hypothetical protein